MFTTPVTVTLPVTVVGMVLLTENLPWDDVLNFARVVVPTTTLPLDFLG